MKKLFLLSILALLTSLLSAQTHWTPIDPPGSTGYTATIIGVVEFEGEEQHSDQLEVGVFHGTDCRGTGFASTVALGRNLVFLSVYGINGEEDTFKIYDHASNTELDVTCNQTYTYQDDSNTGTIPAPYEIDFLFNHFQIGASANPTAGGTVTGAGTYNRNAPVTLKATANTGYTFAKWTKDNVQVSTSATYSFTATAATMGDYVAQFNLNSYEITATASPTAGGTVTGGGTYNHFETCTLTATAATGYTFTNWKKGDEVVSTNPTYSFVVSGAGDYTANFTLNSYSITATANPTAGGTVTGGGTYNHFGTCTLTATAATGYTFTNWKKGDEVVSTNATYSFTVTGAGDYTANFTLNSYEITVAANPTAGGTVTGGGTYNHFETCTLTATAATGYTFTNWKKGDEVVSTNATYSFTVAGGGAYTANFTLNSYEITVAANPTAGGTVTGGGTYNHFETCTLTATAATGYTFTNWKKGDEVVSTKATYSFTVTGAGDYTANFTLNSYSITATADPAAGGTITGAATYHHFETCTLTATANTGYTFVNWTKDGVEVSTSSSINFTVEGAASYVAHFNLNSYEITATADPVAGGSITGAGTYNHFETCTLTATPATGYHFVNWTKGGTVVSTSETLQFEVSGAAEYVAHFEINSYVIQATADPNAGGTVTGAGTYNHFETCTLTATANTGYTFVNWTKDGVEVSTSSSINFMVEGAASYVAHFNLNSYEITATADPAAGGTITGAGSYNHFETCTLTATANTGYTFVNWTKDGVEVSTSSSINFMVEGAASYVAHFNLNSYTITVTADPTAGGIVSGGGTFNHFESCTLTATPLTGYHFVNWTLNGVEMSTSATYNFEVACGGTFVAHFELNSYVISATSDPEYGGTITGAGTYNHFETCTLTATANTGCTFQKWTKDGVDVSTELSISFMVEGAASYVAHFTVNGYVISALANPAEGGTVTGAGGYNHFETCTLIATANEGYTFINWTLNSEEVSTSNTISFEVTGSVSYVANFALNSYSITATANPTAGGTVTGAGTYYHFESCTLTATENTGYTFVNWTKDGVEVSTDPTYTFTVTEAGEYLATFSLNNYEITATADPTLGGSVTGAGNYNHFETCTLTATPNTGYTFLNWKKDGLEVSTNPIYSFEVTEAGAYVATFSLNSYSITVAADPTEGGTVTGAATYNHFETCSLTATVNTGYHFVNWTLNGEEVSTSATYSFEVAGGGAYVAHFELNSYEITATSDPAFGGTITGAGTYNHFETCTLTATANTGCTFQKWTKDGVDVSTEPSISFMVEGAASYVAHFTVNGYEISATADPAEGGAITGVGGYLHGSTATLTATPNEGYSFVNWTKDGVEVSTNATFSFTVIGSGAYIAHFSLNSYEISATADPSAGGTITGVGTYHHFESCTLTATANIGYTFVNWTKDGVEVSTNLSINFTVDGPASYVAHFNLNSYAITATADPTVGGAITGAGTYNHFETCTLTATANTGYTFVNWTKDGVEVSTNTSVSFVVEGEASYVAHFSLNNYAITATADPTAGGSVTGAGTFNHFETCTLTATANTGYTFVNWTKDGVEVSTNLSINFTVDGPASYVAHFNLNSYAITATADPTFGGTITGAGTYNHFENCTLTATPSTGYSFVNWTKDGVEVSTNTSVSFVVEGEASYVAHFSLNSYTITATADPTIGGTVTGAGTYNHFENCTLIATPSTGYHFVNWTLNGVEVSAMATYSFEVAGGGDYVAHFELNSYEITATADPTAGGSVTGAGAFNHFENCTLTATANTGYTFVNWTKDGVEVSTSLSINFTVEGPASYVAHFNLNSYAITATADPTVGGTVTGAGTYNHFENCTLTATPSTGYSFVNWTKDGVEVSTNTSVSFVVEGEASYVAHFSLNSYTITAIADPAVGGSVTGAGTYYYGETATLTATANTDYSFVNWTKDGVEVSTNPTYSFMVTEAGNYVAHFNLNSFEIAVMANPTEGGAVTGAGIYTYGETATLIATANNGYSFVNWTKDAIEVSTSATYSFAVTEAGTYVAHFNQNSYDIIAMADPSEGGSIVGSTTYYYGDTCTLEATSNEGYSFVNWTKDGVEVSTDTIYSFIVTESAIYVGHFTLNSYEITAASDPIAGGTITGTGTYNHFETCTLEATPNEGYVFVNWMRDGEVFSTNCIYVFSVTESKHFVANFELISVEITADADPSDGGTVVGAGTYTYGDEVTMTATPNVEYVFVNWTIGDEVVSEEPEFTFIAEEDLHLVAHFASTVSINETEELAISVYPNPAVDKLMVKSPMPIRQCEVYSITGQRLLLMKDCGELFEIKVHELAPGSYLVRLTSENNIELKKFIKE